MKFLKSLQVIAVMSLTLVFTLTTAHAMEPGLDWATYYGDGIIEATQAIAMGPDGTIYATGFIQPPDWQIDTFVAQYSADGTELLNFTIIDGGWIEGAFCIAVDDEGIVTIAGQTMSPGFPVTEDALQPTFGGYADGFLLQLNQNFEIIYSTFFGGDGEESIVDIAVDKNGAFVVCGYTGGNIMVTAGAFQEDFAGGNVDAFVACIDPVADNQLKYSTYLGGSGNDTDYDPDDVFGASLDQRLMRQAVGVMPNGNIVVSGMTWSTDFPTTPGAFQTEHSPLWNPDGYSYDDADIYVTVLNPAAPAKMAKLGKNKVPGRGQLVYSTLIGGSMRDLSEDLVVKDSAKVILTGLSQSDDFPTTGNAYQQELNPEAMQNVVVMQFRTLPNIPQAKQLDYSTYLGGSNRDAANGLYMMNCGDVVVGGVTRSEDYPTTDGSTFQGGIDMFMTRLDISRKPANQLIFSTLIGGSDDEGLFVGPVGTGSGMVFFGGDTKSTDFPGTAGTAGHTHDGVSYDAIVGRFYIGGMGYPGKGH